MPIFGYDVIGSSNTNSLARGFGHGNALYHHTAGPSDTVTSFLMFTRNIGDTAEVGVYDMGVGGSPNGATLVASATITATSDTAQWEEVSVNIPLTQGRDYFLGYVSDNGIRRYFDSGVAGDSTEDLSATSGTLPATWSEGATDAEIVSLYAIYDEGGSSLSADATGTASVSGNLSPGAGSFDITASPAEIRATEQFSFTVADPATVPTVGNTVGNFTGLVGIAPDSVIGSNPYTINWTLPKTTGRKFNNTGYVFDITVDVETTSSAAIPYKPVTGQQFIELDTPDPSTQAFIQYSFGTPETGDQWVWTTTVNGVTVTYDAQLFVELSEEIFQDLLIEAYLIKASGAVQQEGVIQFDYEVGLFANATGNATVSADLTVPPKTFNAGATGVASVTADLTVPPKTFTASATGVVTVTADLSLPPANVTVEPPSGEVVVEGLTPVPAIVSGHVRAEPPSGEVITVGLTPTIVVINDSVTAQPPVGEVVTEGLTPDARAEGGQVIAQPPIGEVICEGLAPNPSTGGGIVTAEPAMGEVVVEGLVPTVLAFGGQVVAEPLIGEVVIEGLVPGAYIGSPPSIGYYSATTEIYSPFKGSSSINGAFKGELK